MTRDELDAYYLQLNDLRLTYERTKREADYQLSAVRREISRINRLRIKAEVAYQTASQR